MNTTTNYGLKLYEGTDLFNPLTVENVNTGDIDTAMKAISDHSVGTATELTTGTVHALTRADTDRNVFLFVATSNFTTGDTFVLDGTQVSALTPDGQPLATGSYVIGSSVLCALHDTLITVYVNPAKAKDADMLDGHDSSYYATDSDLDTVAGTIQAVSDKVGTAVLTTTAPDCSGAINELNTHLTGTTLYSGVVTTTGQWVDLNVNVGNDTTLMTIELLASDELIDKVFSQSSVKNLTSTASPLVVFGNPKTDLTRSIMICKNDAGHYTLYIGATFTGFTVYLASTVTVDLT
jgi:hypothetical protein